MGLDVYRVCLLTEKDVDNPVECVKVLGCKDFRHSSVFWN